MTFDLAQMIAALQDRTMSWVGDGSQPDPLCTQAAAEITRLTARVAELEGAAVTVKPLVWVKSHMTPWQDDWHTIPTAYTIRCCDENGWKWQGNGGHGYEPSAKHAMTAVQGIREAAIRAALSTHTEEPKT